MKTTRLLLRQLSPASTWIVTHPQKINVELYNSFLVYSLLKLFLRHLPVTIYNPLGEKLLNYVAFVS